MIIDEVSGFQNLAQFAQAGSSRGLAELGGGEAEGLVESGGEVVVAGEAEIERQVGQGQVRLLRSGQQLRPQAEQVLVD